jgi:hypothetical protein
MSMNDLSAKFAAAFPHEDTTQELALRVTNVALDSTPLDSDQAAKLTATIRNAVDVLYILIFRAHAGKAWQALGYGSWAEYVRAEFDMSRSRSYQILDQARVIIEIEASVPAGTEVVLSEAAVRDLRGVLEEVIPKIKERTEGLPPLEASRVVDEVVEEQRDQLRQDREDTYSQVDADETGNQDAMTTYPDELDSEPRPLNTTVRNEISQEEMIKIRKNVNAAHDIYSSLSALSSLPDDIEEVIAIIPGERHLQIDSTLSKAIENLGRFNELWKASNRQALEEDRDESDFDGLDSVVDAEVVDTGDTGELDTE